MKIQFPKKKDFGYIDEGTAFMVTVDGVTCCAIKSDPILDENDVEWNAVVLTTGKHLCLADEEEVVELNGTYVVEG